MSNYELNLGLETEKVGHGLARLALCIIKLLHELLQRQALKRVERRELTDEQMEALGQAFLKQAEELKRLCKVLDIPEDSLNLDLGPLGKLF